MKPVLSLCVATVSIGSAVAALRPTPDYLKRAVVYQVVLRNFTRDGNFRSATDMLDHVRDCGVDVVYLSPFVEMDRDMADSGWSARQKRSGFGSPKNPYRISDYDRIDPEYGDDADFRRFNDRAHELGMKVYMDLVYVHCGPNNVLKDKIPDAFQKNPDGTVRTTVWNFPYLNYESKGVRKYLIDSMLHWIGLGCDGFRCDVGDLVPLDFWIEAVERCQKARPDLVMINEGRNPEYLRKAFDACYAWPWSFTLRGTIIDSPEANGWQLGGERTLAARMGSVREYEASIPADSLMFCFMDNHDTAADDWERRFDRQLPVEAGNAGFVLTFLRRGLPLIFNGNEIADNSLNSFFGPVEHPARAAKTVDWARAVQPAGQERLALVRTLAKMRHEEAVFSEGSMQWVTEGEKENSISFVRQLGSRRVFVSANLKGKSASFTVLGLRQKAKPLLVKDFRVKEDGTCTVGPWGYVVMDIEE